MKINFNPEQIKNLNLKKEEENLALRYLKDKAQYLGKNEGDKIEQEDVLQFLATHIDGTTGLKQDSALDDNEISKWAFDNAEALEKFGNEVGIKDKDELLSKMKEAISELVGGAQMTEGEKKAEDAERWETSKKNYHDAIGLDENGNEIPQKEVEEFTVIDNYKNNPEGATDEYKTKMLDFAQELIKRWDNSKDGSLDFKEFVERELSSYKDLYGTELEMTPETEEIFQEAFKSADLNGDGKVSNDEEVTRFVLADAQEETELDGKISYENLMFTDYTQENVKEALKEAHKLFE